MGELINAAHLCKPLESWTDGQHSIREGAVLMMAQQDNLLVLGSDDTPLSVVSAGDIAQAVAAGYNLDTTPLAEIATNDIISVAHNASLLDCLEIFATHKVRSVLVYDGTQVIGILGKDRIIAEHTALLDTAVATTTTQYEEAAKARDKLLGTAAHDIRNPLGVILAWCELLDDTLEMDMNLEVAEGLQTIRNQANQILNIINQFLDVTQINSGSVELEYTCFDPAEIIMAAYKENITRAQKKMIPLTSHAPLSMQPFTADRHRIHTVISHLISNAIKYSDSGKPTEIRAEDRDDALIIEIEDSGQGIAADEQADVFTVFAKTSSRPTGGETKTRLGLAIAKKVIELHGGTLSLTSCEGKGSTFTIELPRNQQVK